MTELDPRELNDLEDFPYDDPDGDPEGPSNAGEEPGLVFDSLEAFVTRYLLAMYRRAVSGNDTTWCAQWWRHPEAITRLEALWRAWEYLRLDPATGMSVWLRDHCDFHMRVLLSADGPFRGCTPEEHTSRPLRALPSDEIPEELAAWLRAASAGELAEDSR